MLKDSVKCKVSFIIYTLGSWGGRFFNHIKKFNGTPVIMFSTMKISPNYTVFKVSPPPVLIFIYANV
jgi:hypothetical protein